MKRIFLTFCSLVLLLSLSGCRDWDASPQPEEPASSSEAGSGEASASAGEITVTAGGREFSAVLCENAAAGELLEMLPLTLNMSELNGNEKYFYLDRGFTGEPVTPSSIRAGDIMIFGSDCLVLFYEDFTTSYSYTPIGRIENPEGLAEALGDGNVQVSFSSGSVN